MSTEAVDLTPPVAMMEDEIRAMVRGYMEQHDCSPSTLSRLVFITDANFIHKFLAGENYTRDKITKLQDFLIANQPPSSFAKKD